MLRFVSNCSSAVHRRENHTLNVLPSRSSTLPAAFREEVANDSVDNRQPETSSFANRLGGKEFFKDFVEVSPLEFCNPLSTSQVTWIFRVTCRSPR